jgi:NAD(P)-dependent dehydrogenase (short-subunit alcohol dehydrogenase family)
MNLSGEIALVTGAGRGIGLATAEKLSLLGAAVALCDLDLDSAEQGAMGIKGAGNEAKAVQMDVRNPQDWQRALDEITSWKQAPTILVNNAGFDRPDGVANVSLEDWQAVLDVHLSGCLLGMKAVSPGMRELGRGRIVNVSSVYAKIGGQGEAAYTTAKAGIVGLTKSAAQEMARFGVLVNCVLPGLTDTPAIRQMMSDRIRDKILGQTPLRRMAQPMEVANVIAFLCSPESSYVTGAAWEVSGGWNM